MAANKAQLDQILSNATGVVGPLVTDGTNTSFTDVGVPKFLSLASNSASSSVTLANVTGMSFTATASKTYLVELIGTFQSAAATTGIGLALDIPSGTITGLVTNELAATTSTSHSQNADAAVNSATSGVRAATTNTPVNASWVVAVGVTGGTVQLMLRSEVAASAVTLQSSGTVMRYTKIN